MRGFDDEFHNLDHYIRVITDRIWEGRQIERIRDYYSEDCVVETPSVTTVGVDAVIQGTLDTLRQFPDRRLLAEDVIISGDEVGGFLSSHRIFSPMTHAGNGAFGEPTGQTAYARTIADCVCKNNKIIHEWLVRDQSAIARAIGVSPALLARQWLEQRGGRFHKQIAPLPPSGYVSLVEQGDCVDHYRDQWQQYWSTGANRCFSDSGELPIIASVPGGRTLVGSAAMEEFWSAWRQDWIANSFSCEHLVINRRADRHDSMAMRWRVLAKYQGAHFMDITPNNNDIEIMAICHADVLHGQIVREWVLIDEIALWMQILSP
jgi:predicted ester cyclase